MFSAVLVVAFFGFGLFYGKGSHLTMADYWRWFVVHLWVESIFEFFGIAVIALLMVGLKPLVFRWLIAAQGDAVKVAWEAGVRLGQTSEFSLLVAYLGTRLALMSDAASHVVQGATVLTFLVSTYIVIFRYPSPIAVSERLRRD